VCTTILEGSDCVDCIDLYQFHFMFPPHARKEDMWLCGREVWQLCAQELPRVTSRWLMCLVGSVMVVAGISLQLMTLTMVRTQLGAERDWREEAELIYIRRKVDSALREREREARAMAVTERPQPVLRRQMQQQRRQQDTGC
jgi:hypothetical protein